MVIICCMKKRILCFGEFCVPRIEESHASLKLHQDEQMMPKIFGQTIPLMSKTKHLNLKVADSFLPLATSVIKL